jgi:DNA mismatch endonuclease, patch repair protein
MRAIRSKDMRPEMAVRSLVHRMGYRFRLHKKDLPGKPDLVFSPRRKVIFVHGCFWHSHRNCRIAHLPKSNLEYWGQKLQRNRLRDKKTVEALRRSGWKVFVVWECETKNEARLEVRLNAFLED